MKHHAIIPIFIPHRGCSNACVFCNQRAITAREGDITPAGAAEVIEEHLKTLSGRGLDEIEVSFFGGSFTGIPLEEQSAFLRVAKKYKDDGRVDKIHLSTRPDYIDKTVLDNLKKYDVDVIELGVQSFDENVLKQSRRGHDIERVYEACRLIKEYGFVLGVQLMIGLPGDSYEACMKSVAAAIDLKPQLARLYPTVVISGTELFDMYHDGRYKPFTADEMLRTTKDMYKALSAAGITVMRVGLKSTALINNESDCVAYGYHPAFRQLVEGEIARDEIEMKLEEVLIKGADQNSGNVQEIIISAPEELLNNAVGHKACNKKYFKAKYPGIKFKYKTDNSLTEIKITINEQIGK